MRKKGYTILVLVCFSYWILDSGWSYLSFEYNLKKLIFSEPASIIDTFFLRVPPYQIVSRLMVVALFAILGSIILEFLIKRQTAEKERKEAHNTLLTVLHSIDATIYVADLENYEILFMNQHMVDSFGQELTGKVCYQVFRNKTEPCKHCTNDQLLDESGNPKEVVVWEGRNPISGAWYINYDRAIKWVDGRIVRLQIATDITQLKELQEKQIRSETQLRQAQKIESIGNLAGGIAHDFNNILSSIIGYTELALDDVKKDSLLEDNLQEVFRAGKRARDLVKQILAFARQSEEEIKPVQVGTIAKEVLKFIRSSIPSTIEIEQNIQSDSLIMGNPSQVHQILMNLFTNAAYAMEDNGGILKVSLKDVVIGSAPAVPALGLEPGNFIKLMVSDTGVGVSPKVIDSIYEPYFTTKAPGEGTGMGLAVVHGIVESYGGKVTVNSELGKGTDFTIYLPVSKKRKVFRAFEAEILPTGTERILFVDDEVPITKIGELVLARLGYCVSIRNRSVEALELFRSKPNDFDLVITDMTMPDMTGVQLARELLAIRHDIPVILCTGYSKKISDESVAEIGIKAVAYKPIVKADLAETVRRVLDEEKGLNQG